MAEVGEGEIALLNAGADWPTLSEVEVDVLVLTRTVNDWPRLSEAETDVLALIEVEKDWLVPVGSRTGSSRAPGS